MGDCRKILVPVDGSEHSEKAFDWYCDYMFKPGDTVLLIHCIEVPPVPEKRFPYSYDYYGEWKEEVEQLRTKGKVLLHHFGFNCDNRTSQPIGNRRLLMELEPPGRAIVDKAVEESVDFIVIGARGLGKVRRTILGSVSDYIVHHSKVPVTVVPPESWRHHYPHQYPTKTDTEIKETLI